MKAKDLYEANTVAAFSSEELIVMLSYFEAKAKQLYVHAQKMHSLRVYLHVPEGWESEAWPLPLLS